MKKMNEHTKIFYFIVAVVVPIITISSISYYNHLANDEAIVLPYTSSIDDSFRLVRIRETTLDRDVLETIRFMSNANFTFIGNSYKDHMIFERGD